MIVTSNEARGIALNIKVKEPIARMRGIILEMFTSAKYTPKKCKFTKGFQNFLLSLHIITCVHAVCNG